jgi:hypothetical protein
MHGGICGHFGNLEHDAEKRKPVFRTADCAAAKRVAVKRRSGHFGGCSSPKNQKQHNLETFRKCF